MKKTLLYFVLLISLCSYADATDTKPDLTSLRAGAEKGDAHSQLEYGKAIHNTSREEAGIWIQKAADQGLGEAWFWLGYAGLGKEPSVFYYKKAAEKGYPEAYDYLLDELLFRAGSSADVTEAKKFADLARKFNIKIYGVDSKLETIDRCYEAGLAKIPASDQPTIDEIKAFKSSNTDCLSFQTGVGAEKNWDSYRKCLLSQDGIDNNDLAEIYANGWGVERNPKLAMALVCHGSSVPAELEGMVEALYLAKGKEPLKENFYFCNYVTSGMNGGLCAAKGEEIAAKKREMELSSLTAQWTESQKIAFSTLQKAAYDFFSEHAVSEQDMSGTARAQIAISEEASLNDEFLKDIKMFESGQMPKDSDFAKADKTLNTLYLQFMKQPDIDQYGAVTKEGIKATQRTWIKYRDAWIKFVEVKYPNHHSNAWKVWLTKQRIAQLNDVISTN